MKRLLSALLALIMCLSLCVIAAADEDEDDPNHIHFYIPIITEPATCTGTGIMTYTCLRCGDTWEEKIPATGHIFSEEWQQNETYHWHKCINFGCSEVADMDKHIYKDGVWLNDGTGHWQACDVCGHATEAVPHTWDKGKITKASTCVEKGVRTYTCTVCGATKTEPVSLAGHSWDGGTTTVKPTITEKGESTFRCIVCGKTTTREIDPLGLSMTPEELLTVEAEPNNVLNGRLEDEKWVILQAVTTEEEYSRIQNGWPITVTLAVTDAGNAVSDQLAEKVQKTAGKQKLYCYLDLNLSKEMYRDPALAVEITEEPVIVALTLPMEMMETASKRKERGFTVYKIEDDSVKKIAAKLSEDGKSFLLQTNEMGTYALAYHDVRTASGFNMLILLYGALGLLTLGGIGFLSYKLFFAKGKETDEYEAVEFEEGETDGIESEAPESGKEE